MNKPLLRKTKLIVFFMIFLMPYLLSAIDMKAVQGATFLPHELHAKLTGSGATSDTLVYDVYGTDLGIIVKHNNKYYYIFGDTFGSYGTNWRSNTMAFSTDENPSNGILFDGWITGVQSAYAKELISSMKVDEVEKTCIPTTALSYNNKMYIYYMSVRHWNETGGMWVCNNASIAVSLNNGQTFSKVNNISWAGESHFVQFGFAQDFTLHLSDGYFYFLATPAGRYDACYLCRVPQTALLNQLSYEYYSGKNTTEEPIWSSDYNDSVEIFPVYVGELSVLWNVYLEKWTAYYFDNVKLKIVVRLADNLWGPWGEPYNIVGAGEYPTLYGAFVHPDLVENNGQTVYFIMSKFNVYNTFVMSVDLSSLTSITNSINLFKVGIFFSIVCNTMLVMIVRKKK